MPTVSISLPCYNEEAWVGATIESVLAQTFEDFELIVVDDGSDDGTAQVVAEYTDDPRVEYVYQENSGVAAAQNTGLARGNGRYYAIIEADDLWEPDKLARQVDHLERTDAGLVHLNAHVIDANGDVIGRYHDEPPPDYHDRDQFLEALFFRNFICTPTVVMDAAALGDRTFDEAYSQSHDHDMWLRIAADNRVEYLDEPLARKRVHEANLSGDYRDAFTARQRFVRNAVERFPELAQFQAAKLSQIHLTRGINSIIRGDTTHGRSALRTAIKYDPTNWKAYATYGLSYFGPRVVDTLSKSRATA